MSGSSHPRGRPDAGTVSCDAARMPSDAFRALFDRHAAYVLERQLLFEKEVAGQPWEADVEEGLLVVGARRARVEVLATYSSQSQTLLWSWARAAELGQGWPEPATRAASRLRDLGAGVAELESGMISMPSEEADDAILVALGVLGQAGLAGGVPLSYRGDHDHGSVYLYVDAPELVARVECPALRMSSLFPQLLAMGVPLSDPRAAFTSYARAHRMDVTRGPSGEGEETVRARDATGSAVAARFDAAGRLLALTSDLTAEAKTT